MSEKWERVLYKKPKHPDNYSDDFLNGLKTNRKLF